MASDFSTLPGHKINYPIANFKVPAPPPVSPTAAMAAQLAKEITDLGDRLSPEARKQKEMQMALLGSKLRSENQNNELQQMQIAELKRQQAVLQKQNADAQETLDKAFGPSNKDKTSVLNPPRIDLGDTHPLDYYNKDLSIDRPGVANLQMSGEVSPALPTDEIPADMPQLDEVDTE